MTAPNRGSTAKIVAIKEATPGTTPSTPTMIELPPTGFTPSFDNTAIKSAQIRAHPFVDRMMQGRFMANFGLDFELQAATHDILFETMFGGAITAKSLAFVDALKTISVEQQIGGGSSLFDQYTYGYLSSMSISCGATDTAPVKATASGAFRTATLGASATIASSVTAAGAPDPFVFVGASLLVAGSAEDVTSGTLNMERAVDPLMVWGNRNPRDFVPGAVAITGSFTTPYDDALEEGRFTNYSSNALVFTFGDLATSPTAFRRFTVPKTKLNTLAAGYSDRGARMQEYGFEAFYDTTTTTGITMTTE